MNIMKIKSINTLSITECCEELNLRREDLPKALQNIIEPSERDELLIEQLQSLLDDDKSAIESCRTIEQYEGYLSTWVDGLYHDYARTKISQLKAASKNKHKKNIIFIFIGIILVTILLCSVSVIAKKYDNWKETNRIRDSIQFAQDNLRKIEEKRIADYNNLLDCIFKYEYVGDFIDGVAPAHHNGKSGYINLAGETIIAFKYSWSYPFYNGLAVVESGIGVGFIDMLGNEVVPIKYQIHPASKIDNTSFREGLEPVRIQDKWGYIDNKGNTIIPFQFDDASYFKNGLAQVRLDDRCGWINKTGEIIIPFAYSYYGSSESFVDNLVCVRNITTKKYGYIDSNGNVVIPCIYRHAYDFSMGLAAVSIEEDKEEKWGYIDNKGNIIIPLEYYDVSHYFNESGLAIVKEWYGDDGKYIDLNGNFVEDPSSYSLNFNNQSDKYFSVHRNGKYGFRDMNYNIIIPCKYDYVNEFSGDIAIVHMWKGDSLLYGCVNKLGVEIIKPEYEYVSYNKKYNLIYVSHNGKNGVSNVEGKQVVPISFDKINYTRISSDEILIRAENQEQVVVYDQDGRKLR